MSTMLIQSGTLDDIADAIRAKTGGSASMTPLQMPTQIASIPSGGGIDILSGVTNPNPSQGSDGDFYLRYTDNGVKNSSSGGQAVNTGYSGNSDSEYVIDFMINSAQSTSYPTIFGARPSGSIANTTYVIIGANAISLAWGTLSTQAFSFGYNSLVGKFCRIELKSGEFNFYIDGVKNTYTFTPTTITSTSAIGIFAMLQNGAKQTTSITRDITFFGLKISENGSVVHNFIPAKDNNDVPCIYDEIDEVYKYVDTGSLTWVDADIISTVYRKINGVWTNVIGADINDIITS